MSDKQVQRDRKNLEKMAAIEGVKCINDFYYFFRKFWPEMSGDKYVDANHIKYLCDKLQFHAMKVIRGEFCNDTVIINVPPGSSKSTIVTIALGTWVWLHAPHLATTNVSYSARLSERHAKKARSITDSDKWSILFDNIFKVKHGKELKIVTQNQNEMINNFKGERFNASVEGTITGMHADIIAKDDMQNPQEAKSDTMRQNANEWDEETLSSRHKNPMCWLDIIIAQRLHEEDLTGYTLNKDITIYQYQLPAEITNASKVIPKDAEKIYTDGILDPNRRPKSVLEMEKKRMGSSAFTCQYLQAPFNLEEQDIKPSMFQEIPQRPENVIFDLWVDGAFTEKTENDPTGIDVLAKQNNDLIWADSFDVRKKLPDLLAFIKKLEANKIFDRQQSRIFIEPKASGSPLADLIEHETDYNFVRIGEHNKQERQLVQGGKTARHETIKPKAESHRIKYVKGTWNDEAITQICGFPKAAHDEHVDNLGYAINHYYFNENTFIQQYALDNLENNLSGSVPIKITSKMDGFKISTSYDFNDKGDIDLFEIPNMMYKYRYICVLVPGTDDIRENTSILVLDRKNLEISAIHTTTTPYSQKIAKKAIEIAHTYDKAKLVVVSKNEMTHMGGEESDLSNIAISEIRKMKYDNIYFRMKIHDIRRKRERMYGFEAGRSGSREVFHNLKDMAEKSKIKIVPKSVYDQMRLLERKKETGEISTKEGYGENLVLGYAVALKISEEMQDEVTVRKSPGRR